jgi:predicted DNA-binding protein (UPF0278 family)
MANIEWVVTVTDKLIAELAQSFQMGPIYEEGLRFLNEQLVEQVTGLKIEIFANEHPPPHFRVKYAGETANFTIEDCRQINGGLYKWRRNIKEWHNKNRALLIEIWNNIRPSDCPVGEYRGNTN